ncbi:MAG: hypothetical protein OXS29_05390 [bacterium]|nr:hypothetical protein [bacterium]MDE0437754.1 hypothetical protein [bacterium]
MERTRVMFAEAIRTAEPWTVRSELAGLVLFVLLVLALWRLWRAGDRQ